MGSHEIKFLSELRQGRLRIDSGDRAANIEELCCAAEERFVVWVEAESLVAEEPTEVEKISRAAYTIHVRVGTDELRVSKMEKLAQHAGYPDDCVKFRARLPSHL